MDKDNNRGMRDWLIFIRIAEAGSIAEAARQLDMTSPGVSKALIRFERYLKATLFTRTPQGMILTEIGQITLTHAREIVTSFHSLLEDIRGNDLIIKGSIRLAAPAIVCEYLACDWIYDYICQHPNVRVFLDSREKDDLRRESPELDDLVLRSGRIESDDLVHRKLSPVKLILCASPLYLQNNTPICHPSDLVNHQVFGMHQHGLAGPLMLSRGDDSFLLDVPSESKVSSNNLMAMLSLVVKGKGISLATPAWLAADYISRGVLVPILPEWKIPDLPVWLIWRQRSRHTKLFTNFRDFIEKCWEDRPKIK